MSFFYFIFLTIFNIQTQWGRLRLSGEDKYKKIDSLSKSGKEEEIFSCKS